MLTLPHSQPLDEVGSLSVMGDACAPLAGNGDVAHVLTREEEQLHMAHGKAKNERRAALDSGDKDENSGGKGGKSFFSRAGKVRPCVAARVLAPQELTLVARRRRGCAR